MTNEQAKELAEKVWPEIGWVDYRSYAEEKERYSVCKGSDIYNAKSYEEAFLAAGVTVCGRCRGSGEEEPSGSEYPAASLGAKFRCGLCNGLGYRLVKGVSDGKGN
ncbi:MAG: hypothetical protein WC433_01825 [Candidatus Omnitrophota bacterium]